MQRLKFLTSTQSPLRANTDLQYESLGAEYFMKELFSSNNSMCYANLDHGKILTASTMFRGKMSSYEIDTAVSKAQSDKTNLDFIEWIPDNMLWSHSNVSNQQYPMSASMLCNSTSITEVLSRIEDQYTKMFNRKAFLH